ncbi:putative tricarboxylic transport membrane protein [Promicromonospora umidemergens]|uniref:Tripartite tricarboxylate transporter substrate-binding protein n=1 Tax=Promicromonospora umidemergens TaxID=629679 RepID=A0ABP8XBS0_9MICO|nr:tripartite tricarboxylate transporter substrate-binding protein [Promicromonospora umidemergens]MCP2281486.1 putative tricarboxylic transport membrane protein [Promicromonospora umidemergens]
MSSTTSGPPSRTSEPAEPGHSRSTGRRRGARLALAATLAVTLVAVGAGCGVTRGDDSADLDMWIPNSPGGGYDQTGRAAVGVLDRDGITGGDIQVTNILGAGGSVAMSRLMGEAGNERLMMTLGLGVVGSTYSFGVDARPHDATPLAQLIEEQEGVLVPADSPFRTIDDLEAAWQEDPGSVVVGGGSSPGGPDHLFPMQLAKAVDVDPKDVRYVSYDGGGPLTSALLGNKIQVGFSGLAEFEGQIEAGELRVLAVSGEERLTEGVLADVPTLTESGIDLVFTNWRGVVAPPGISEERRAELIEYLTRMHDSPEWEQALADNGWTDAFVTGDDFEQFLREQDERVSTTLKELNLL